MASKKKSLKKSTSSRKSSRGEARRARGLSEPEAKTMEELLAQAGSPFKSANRGQTVKGKITAITKKNVMVDIGGKSEGMVAERAFAEAKDFIKTLKVGDEINARVLIPETPDGFVILSLRAASHDATWRKINESQKTGEAIYVTGKSVNPSGVIVDVEDLEGFIPASLLGRKAASNTQSLIGKRFQAVVVEAVRGDNKVVLSEKQVSEAGEIQLAKDAISKVKNGEIYEGVVTKIYAFGCFVKIKIKVKKDKEVAVEGLVHISELSWEKISQPEDEVSEGDKVKVKVIGKEEGKLSFSIKQAKTDPWEEIGKKYKKDSKFSGKVVKLSDYGVFIKLEPGVEGLIHMTKIPPGEKLEQGKEVKVYVEEIDSKNRKLSLGLVLTKKPVGYK